MSRQPESDMLPLLPQTLKYQIPTAKIQKPMSQRPKGAKSQSIYIVGILAHSYVPHWYLDLFGCQKQVLEYVDVRVALRFCCVSLQRVESLTCILSIELRVWARDELPS